jgi:hypothetical protein
MSNEQPYGKEMLDDDDGPEPFRSDNVTPPDTDTDRRKPPPPPIEDRKITPLEISEPVAEEKTSLRFRGRVLTLTGRVLRSFLLGANFILLIFALGVLIGAGYNSNAHVFALIDTWFTLALVLGFFLLCLAMLGALGAMSQNRVLLWLYVSLLFLLGLIDMIASSYALSMARDGARFLMNAWDMTPAPIRENLQVTFECCGLFAYLDSRAVLPCPDGSGSANSTFTPPSFLNATGQACMPPMVDQFNRYSTGVPTVGLVLCFMMWGVAFLTWQLIRAIANSIRESAIETL